MSSPSARKSARPKVASRPRTALPVAQPSPRRRLLPSILTGLLFGLVALAGGGAAVIGQSHPYSATASLLVLPAPQKTADSVASLYDSLSQGQVVQSYRAVMASPGFTRGVVDGLDLSPEQRPTVAVDAKVVPSTALIDVTTTAKTGAVAEQVSDAVARQAVTDLSATFNPFRITLVSSAAETAKVSGTGSSTLLGVVVLLALVVAVAVQQAVLFVTRSRDRRSS